jgi:hypothetical protein
VNYFAHGLPFLDQPYVLAGTAVPDWLSVVDRRMRVRSKSALPFCTHEDRRVADLARGIVRHHDDDRWFHQTRAFVELTLELTHLARTTLAGDPTFRPSFLGHILVELLLDAELIAADTSRLDAYYRALVGIDHQLVEHAVVAMATRPSSGLARFLEHFCRERFLYDYLEDGKLLSRLNLVMRRVGLPALPPGFADLFPQARERVRSRQAELWLHRENTQEPSC